MSINEYIWGKARIFLDKPSTGFGKQNRPNAKKFQFFNPVVAIVQQSGLTSDKKNCTIAYPY